MTRGATPPGLIHVAPLPPGDPTVEVAERKGLGHPDTICDGVAEAVSRRLSRFYLERFGAILHHNVDKLLLCGGAARPAFGGGEVLEPIDLYLAGRAVCEVRGERVPVEALVVESARTWLREHLRSLDADRHVRIHSKVRPGSEALVELFGRRPGAPPLANDTSCGTGYAPLSALERAVLAVEQRLNAAAVKEAEPALGEDVKVMGVRAGDRVHLTLACAMVGRHLRDLHAYTDACERARALAARAARDQGIPAPAIRVNAADAPERGSVYLTVTGTSAEAGDDGEAGRGNRANGLMAPLRPTTLESVAGKNPVSHVGKIYNLAAERIASAIISEIPAVQEAHCLLVSLIGQPITEPQLASLRLRCKEEGALAGCAETAREIAGDHLSGLGSLWRALLEPTEDRL